MNEETKILLIGGGGHCRSVIDVIERENRFTIAGIIDLQEKVGSEIFGYRVIGADEDLPKFQKEYRHAVITLGQVKSAAPRIGLFEMCKRIGFELPTIVSPSAYVSSHAKIGEGTVVMHHALVNAGASVGKNCIINSKALIEHDCFVDDHCHISTGAILNGGAIVKKGSFIGSNATTREGAQTMEDEFVKAGSLFK